MKSRIAEGIWPTMITPFRKDKSIDYNALNVLVDWYIDNGADGLFAVCQSSEMFFLTLEERIELAEAVIDYTGGRCPVIASGHVSSSSADQITEIKEIAKTGVDAVVLVPNRLSEKSESESIWFTNLEKILDNIPEDIPLGLYECPYPYKKLLSDSMLKKIADMDRFFFLKDTASDLSILRRRSNIVKNSNLKLYNANSATFLSSLNKGYAGFSGVMANFHPSLYKWVWENSSVYKHTSLLIQSFLSTASLIELRAYPANAKLYLQKEGIPMEITCRVDSESKLDENIRMVLDQLRGQTKYWLSIIETTERNKKTN